ncbi:MAG TPA: histone deacetylase [Vicinamibacteria bacterium]|nr:histone deacetylase [Vicinamibacteria bacterium]
MKTRRDFVLDGARGLAALGWGSTAMSEEAKRTTGFVYDEIYLTHVIRPDHVESPKRLRRILEEMRQQGLETEVTKIPRMTEPMPHIAAHHQAQHVAGVERIPTTGKVAEAAVGGALAAVKAVSDGAVPNAFCALRPPGHHANNTGEEEGFCYYSNAAIAAKYAQSLGHEKVLIIDWDYHHGNATQNAFYDDPTVLFFSSHDWHAYPGTGDPALTGAGEGSGLNINVHLECHSRDKDMLDAWDRKLLPSAEKFEPDFIIISAGFDSRREDLLGCFDVTDDAFARMTRTTMDVARRHCDGRIVSLLEGGYNVDGLAKAVAAHISALLGG